MLHQRSFAMNQDPQRLNQYGSTSVKSKDTPFKATRVWDELVNSFQSKLHGKRCRRNLKTYDNCFTANKAIETLFAVLKSSDQVNGKVTREQALKLLNKFLLNHVIEDVKGNWGTEDLSEGKRLYRFPSDHRQINVTSEEPSKEIDSTKTKNMTRSLALRSVNNSDNSTTKRTTTVTSPKFARANYSTGISELPLSQNSLTPQSKSKKRNRPRFMSSEVLEVSQLVTCAKTCKLRKSITVNLQKNLQRKKSIRTPPKPKRYSVHLDSQTYNSPEELTKQG